MLCSGAWASSATTASPSSTRAAAASPSSGTSPSGVRQAIAELTPTPGPPTGTRCDGPTSTTRSGGASVPASAAHPAPAVGPE